jgi:hypothetical protein
MVLRKQGNYITKTSAQDKGNCWARLKKILLKKLQREGLNASAKEINVWR